MAFEHGKDEDLGTLHAIDDPVRPEEHFADMLATTLGDLAARERAPSGFPGALPEARDPSTRRRAVVLSDEKGDRDKIILRPLGPAEPQRARSPILAARMPSSSSSSTTRPASASARPCSMAATTRASSAMGS